MRNLTRSTHLLSRRSVLLGGAGTLVLAAAGCAQPTPTPVPPSPTAPPSAPPAPTTTLVAAKPTAAPAAAAPAKLAGTLTIYSGRTEKLVAPVLEKFARATGVEVKARYGDTAELAAAILEEGRNSPADLFFAQETGALGALAKKDFLARLPDSLLTRVDERFRSPKGTWVGISGRARVVAYSTKSLQEPDLPDSILGFADPKWKGRIGWAPTNASFQASVTALRLTVGEDGARSWLKGVLANNPKKYPNNTAQVVAAGAGEIEVGLVNHYYLYNVLKDKGESYPVRNYHPRAGDAGAMVLVAGVGILTTTRQQKAAEALSDYLLTRDAQEYFANETFEYPLLAGVPMHKDLLPLAQIKTPKLDLSNLDDLDGTLKLLRDVGIV